MKIDVSAFSKLTLAQKNERSILRGLNIKYGHQLKELSVFYPKEIGRLTKQKNDILDGTMPFAYPLVDDEIIRINEKIERLTDKYVTVLDEIELRKKKTYKRTPVGTIYYIDLTNGNDARTGLKIGPSTIDSTADTTHFVDDALTGADDYINGSYVWNVTRGIGALILDFAAATDEVTLATPIAGMTAGDTYYILDAWKTLGKYTSVTVRTAGDIAYVRANTTQTLNNANLDFDESGTAVAIISIIGCDAVTNNPWGDASNTYPILSFGDAAYYALLDTNYWLLKRLSIRDTTKTSLGLLYAAGQGCQISYCNITDSSNAACCGLFINGAGLDYVTFVDNCVFNNNISRNISIGSNATLPTVYISNCTFDGGAETTDYGIYASLGAAVYVSNSTFGSTTAHDTEDILAATKAKIYCRNCTFNKATLNILSGPCTAIHSEDDDGVFGQQVSYYFTGKITKSATARPGGASSSAQMMPSANCNVMFPLCLNNILSDVVPDFAIYNTSTSPVTVTVYIRATAAWVTYPTVAQLFVEASYLSNAASAARATAISNDVLADGSTWIGFDCTFTPARAGWIYLKVYLGLYEASKGILVDIKPIMS